PFCQHMLWLPKRLSWEQTVRATPLCPTRDRIAADEVQCLEEAGLGQVSYCNSSFAVHVRCLCQGRSVSAARCGFRTRACPGKCVPALVPGIAHEADDRLCGFSDDPER